MTKPKPPLMDTHSMTAKEAVEGLAQLRFTKPQLKKIRAHEKAHRRPRKQILDALRKLIDAKPVRRKPRTRAARTEGAGSSSEVVVAVAPSPHIGTDPSLYTTEPEVVTEDTPEPVAEPEPIADAPAAYEPPSGELAEALIGATVQMNDSFNRKHEVIVVRDTLPEERPIIGTMRDVFGTEVFLRHDPTGKLPMSWRLP